MSRSNRLMMAIIEDSWSAGTHDLQKGMCSASRFKLAAGEADVGAGALREHGPLRILVAEDHHVNQALVRTMLGRAGHLVDLVGDKPVDMGKIRAFYNQFDLPAHPKFGPIRLRAENG